jgi:methylenetetrahydrofolate reductase (NADPH)
MSVVAPQSGGFAPDGGPRVSFEVFPARSTMQCDGMSELVRVMGRFKPEFVSVTYGAGGSSREASFATVSQILEEGDFPVVGHVTCAGQPRSVTDAVIERYAAQGLAGILALRGDMPGVTGPYVPHPDGYINATDLAAAVVRRGDLDCYVAAYPETHPASPSPEACVENLKTKLETGAKAAITQFFFDNRDYFDFLERVRAAGIHEPIIPGVLLIHDFQKISGFAARCKAKVPASLHAAFAGLAPHSPEHKARACEIAAEQIMKLAAQGVDQMHIYTMDRPDLVEQTCRLAGIAEAEPALAMA